MIPYHFLVIGKIGYALGRDDNDDREEALSEYALRSLPDQTEKPGELT